MITTNHATNRWRERFPNWDIEAEYAVSKGIGHGKNFKKATRCLHSKHSEKLFKNGGTQYMLLSKNSGAVFIMDKGEVVVTVLKIEC
ncbi:MAG: hypothetical protein V3V74_02215 [Nitrosomonadaceae bacterium]